MTHASLCTGIGACELAATWMEWENLFSCEIDEFCNKVLEYHYPNSKHYGNIFGTDFRKWRGQVDVLTAGFPCQPFSVAGRRDGAEDDRYLWPEVLRVIGEVRPRWFIGENVAGIGTMVLSGKEIKMGSYKDICGENYTFTEKHERFVLTRICEDLESIRYSIQTVVIPACAVGAPHRRDRVWFIANSADAGLKGLQKRKNEVREFDSTTDSPIKGFQDRIESERWSHEKEDGARMDYQPERYGEKRSTSDPESKHWRGFPSQSPVCSRDDGISSRLSGFTFSYWREECIKAYGNTMVPQVVYEIFKAIELVDKTFKQKTN